MEKVRIVALEDDKNNVVAALHDEKIIDFRKSKLEISDDKPASYSTEISDALIKINGVLQILSGDLFQKLFVIHINNHAIADQNLKRHLVDGFDIRAVIVVHRRVEMSSAVAEHLGFTCVAVRPGRVIVWSQDKLHFR